MPRRVSRITDPGLQRGLQDAMNRGALLLPDACRFIRARDGLTQAKLASRAGVALKVVKQLESGKGNPGLESLERLAKVMGMRVRLVRPSAIVRLGAAESHIRRHSAVRRAELRTVRRGKATLRARHARNALRGSDFTIETPPLS